MLRTTSALYGWTIRGSDGEIGSVNDLLFDDQQWTIRYLVVDTGDWLSGRLVLVSPIAVSQIAVEEQRIDVALTQDQIEKCPDIFADPPVSRQKEMEYFQYYGYAPYWGGTALWGAAMYPGALAAPPPVAPAQTTSGTAPVSDEAAQPEDTDPHLRSTNEVSGYYIQASDGEIGHVEDFLVDPEVWAIRYMLVDTKNWWPGKNVLVSPRWISKVSWGDATVTVDLPRDAIEQAPEFDSSQPLDREYEARLHAHYRRPAYWEAEHTA